MNNQDIRVEVLLALQVALLGMVTRNIRAITCGWNSTTITVRFIYDSKYSEDDNEICEEIVTEVMSHFPNHNVDSELVILPWPKSIKEEVLLEWVYIRHEEKGTEGIK